MYSKTFTAASLVALTLFQNVISQDVSGNDVPNQCNLACNAVVNASSDCERYADNDGESHDDQVYSNCMCTGSNAQSNIELCEACVYQARLANGNSQSDARSNDVNDLLSTCGFSTSTYNLATPSAPSAPMFGNTMASTNSLTATATVTVTTGRAASTVSSISGSLSSASASLNTATGSAASSLSTQVSKLSSSLASATSAAATGNVAPMVVQDVRYGGAAFAGAAALLAAALV